MSYTSGDWTARTKYLLGSKLCFPRSDEDALEQFLASYSTPNLTPYSHSEPAPVPLFPVGTPSSIQFGKGTSTTLITSSMTLCEAALVTNASGKIGIWASVDTSGDPITLTISINGSVVASTATSLFLFYGTPTAETAGTYTITLRATNTGSTNIVSSSVMAVGLLS
jgi:hypothetical protein